MRPHLHGALVRGREVDPASADLVAMLGAYQFYFLRDYAAAEARYRRAIELNPSPATAHLLYALFLGTMRRPAARRGVGADRAAGSAQPRRDPRAADADQFMPASPGPLKITLRRLQPGS